MLILVTFFFGLDIYLVSLFEKISKHNKIQQELSLAKQQAKLVNNYYHDIESKYEESRKIIHDVKNHLQVLRSLNNADNIIAFEYETVIYKKIKEISIDFKCSDHIINILLNYKISVCKQLGITYEIAIQDVNLDFIEAYDKTTLFSNVLDNAIEACKESTCNKHIEIRMHQFNDFIVINVINSYELLNLKGNKFLSTKAGHSGIGISNIKYVLNKYNGNIKFEYHDNNFYTKIVIPIYS